MEQVARFLRINGNLLKDVVVPSVIIIAVILGGVATGWKLSGIKSASLTSLGKSNTMAPGAVKKGDEIGSTDSTTFKDEAEGTLQEGGVNGEGAFHLDRPGGESQTAALTSSVLDLSEFVGKKVHIWGQTQSSTKAAWFMDVGKVKILE